MEPGRALPTWMPPLTFVQFEPGPVTVTSPLPNWPTTPPAKVKSVPPFWMVRLPTPIWPTTRRCATAPAVAITVAFGNVTLIFASLPPSTGTPAVQLAAVNQSGETVPVQLVWACVETADTAKSALVARNLDETNLQAAHARDLTRRAGPMDDSRCGSRPTLAPNQSAMPIIENCAATQPGRD
jgi:hypothetical protein